MKQSFSSRMRKKGDKLQYILGSHLKKYEQFLQSLPEGTAVEVFINVDSEDGSLAQIAKLMVMIRELAVHTGNTVEGLKLVIKDKTGLCYGNGETFYCKSFADCSKEELSKAIEQTILFGEFVGHPVG